MGIPVLSFFTGGGFLDIGFEEAGFDIIWTNEYNNVFADMYEFGVTAWRQSKNSHLGPAVVSNRESIESLSQSNVMRQAFGISDQPHFGIIGGPPCPDFSLGGKHGGGKGKNGRLSQVYIDLICSLGPDFFIMENVPGLSRCRKHRLFLESLIKQLSLCPRKYRTTVRLLNALEFGVPQNRERLFLIGVSTDIAEGILGRNTGFGEDWFPWPKAIYPRVKELPWPTTSPFGTVPDPALDTPLELSVYPLLTSTPSPIELPNGQDVFNAYSGKFWEIAEGDDSHKSFKRLHRYRYSPTAWYGNNEVHLHPWEPRRLSVREAMRIQSIPDTYILPAACPLSAKFRFVGNGVPCRLAETIATAIARFLRGELE